MARSQVAEDCGTGRGGGVGGSGARNEVDMHRLILTVISELPTGCTMGQRLSQLSLRMHQPEL